MKLRPSHISQISALILLGSLVTAPAVVMGYGYNNEENDEENAYEMEDSYGNQTQYDEDMSEYSNRYGEYENMSEDLDNDDDDDEYDEQREEEFGGYNN